ncbi:MAG: hypothetical protein ACHQF2_05470 [Flavobacteriales bacterium]
MNTDEISKKAEKERERQKKKKWKFRLNREEKPVFSPSSPESWWVYSRIYPYHWNVFIWIYLVLTIGIVFFGLYYMEYNSAEWMWYTGIIGIGLFTLRITVHNTLKIIRYFSYRNWRKTLPFTLTGWDKIGSVEHFPGAQYWNQEARVKVTLKGSLKGDGQRLVKDALFLLTVEANKCFYTPGMVQAGYLGDIRKKWKVEHDTTVVGSANGAVLGDMYQCIHKHLRAIQNAHGIIDSVKVEFSDSNDKVEPISTD